VQKIHLSFTFEMFSQSILAVLAVAATTALLWLIGRNTLGEAVIALLYLVPIGWSASRWGQGPGLVAAVVAALTFDFFFIPPFYTFTVGSLEGWLVLAIFLAVAVVIVGRVQSGLSKARASEREAIFMYELSTALAGLRTQSAVAYTLARRLEEMFQASSVKVILQAEGQSPSYVASEPREGVGKGKPNRVLPILNAWGLVGEIQLWRGYTELPPEESRLLQNFALQAAQALERTRLAEAEEHLKALTSAASVK